MVMAGFWPETLHHDATAHAQGLQERLLNAFSGSMQRRKASPGRVRANVFSSWWLLFVGLLSLCTAAQAQDFIGTRALSLGEAYRAVATGNDAIYMNPAGIALIPRYSSELHYNFNLDKEDHQVDLSVVDSRTSKVAAGLGYTFQGRELTRRTTLQHTATLALGYALLPRLFHLGVGLKYVNISDAIVGNYLNALSGDVGVLATLPGGLSLAAVGYNLIPIRSTDVPVSAGFAAAWDLGPLSALLFGGGPSGYLVPDASGTARPAAIGDMRGPLSNFVLSCDWYINFFTLEQPQSRVSGGLEYLLFGFAPIRLGYQWDEAEQNHLISAGGGIILPFFGVDVAYQQSTVNRAERRFAASLKFFLDL